MEHKLFYSKLKQSVEDSTLFEIIESSSSGENPHRAASMELVFERSIREHREWIAVSAKESKTPIPPSNLLVIDKKPAMEKKPAEKKPAEESKPVEERKPVEKKPVEEKKPTEKKPVEKKPVTIEPAPAKIEKKRPPPSKPADFGWF